MPCNYDFSRVENVQTMEINPKGWVNPITIEYGVSQANKFDTVQSICWRVKGTTHTFTIYEYQLNEISKGNIKEHFTQVLEYFQSEYHAWFTLPEFAGCTWKEEYRKQYRNFIING